MSTATADPPLTTDDEAAAAAAKLQQEEAARAEREAAEEADRAAKAAAALAATFPGTGKYLYMVLWAKVPEDRATQLAYRELGYANSNTPDGAKEVALKQDTEAARLALKSAGEVYEGDDRPRGILLRAVPRSHWPDDVEATTYEVPEPILTIR